MIYVVTTLLVVFMALFALSAYANVRLAKKVFVIEDQTEWSLDVLNDVFARLSHAATIPIMDDDPVVKQVVNDIKEARDAVLVIASKIAAGFEQEDENE